MTDKLERLIARAKALGWKDTPERQVSELKRYEKADVKHRGKNGETAND